MFTMDVMPSSQVGCVHNGCHAFPTWFPVHVMHPPFTAIKVSVLFACRIKPDPLAKWEEEVTLCRDRVVGAAEIGWWELQG